jgi:hypothetical protein
LLAVGSVASLAANVAAAQPTITGRLVAAWPSFALICSYELLMRHVRRNADADRQVVKPLAPRRRQESPVRASLPAPMHGATAAGL